MLKYIGDLDLLVSKYGFEGFYDHEKKYYKKGIPTLIAYRYGTMASIYINIKTRTVVKNTDIMEHINEMLELLIKDGLVIKEDK